MAYPAPRLIRPASPGHAGLRAPELAQLAAETSALPESGWCGGAVLAAGRGPYLAVEHAAGWAQRHTSRYVELPPAERAPAHPGTRFDLASLTKLCTAIAAAQQLQRGTLQLDGAAARYLPEFGAAGKERVTVRQLLTHTSGLRPELPLYERPQDPLAALWAEPLTSEPGRRVYSDLNLIAVQQVLERITGHGLDTLVRDGITGPLGMTRTSFGPVPAAGAAATEDQRRPWAKADRGMLRGTVHDENAWVLGGVAGHAGLFGTARDLAVLCRALLCCRAAAGCGADGATGAGASANTGRILSPESVRLLLDPPGLGFEVDQPWFMGELAGPHSAGRAAGHTGFTGTSLVLDPATDTFLVLLATTVHPVRPGSPDSAPRARAGTLLARAVIPDQPRP